ncbi:flagellar basal body protein, partial [Xanthomonas citri pv. citri]
MSIFSIATSGLSAASLRVNVAASNIANVNTTGPLPASGGSNSSAGAGIAPTFPAVYVPLRV